MFRPRDSLLHGVTFKGARLPGVCLDGAVISQVNAYELPFSEDQLKACVLDPTAGAVKRIPALSEKLSLHEMWASTDGREGQPSVLDGEDLRPFGPELRGRHLTVLSLQNVVAVGVDFSGCQLQGANFMGADLRDTRFEDADLRGAIFNSAKLAHARFGRADLRPLALKSEEAQPVDLSNARYSPGQFATAIRGPNFVNE